MTLTRLMPRSKYRPFDCRGRGTLTRAIRLVSRLGRLNEPRLSVSLDRLFVYSKRTAVAAYLFLYDNVDRIDSNQRYHLHYFALGTLTEGGHTDQRFVLTFSPCDNRLDDNAVLRGDRTSRIRPIDVSLSCAACIVVHQGPW